MFAPPAATVFVRQQTCAPAERRSDNIRVHARQQTVQLKKLGANCTMRGLACRAAGVLRWHMPGNGHNRS